MNKIKIAILIDVLEDIKAGAERQVFEIAKRINKDKFELFLYILHQEKVPVEFAGLGMPICGFGVKRIYGFSGLREGFEFRDMLQDKEIDVLMTIHFASDIWGAIFGKLAGVKTIISSRRDIGFWRNKNHVRAYKFVNRWVSKIVVVSEAVKRMVVEEEGVAPDKVITIYNGVDLKRFEDGGRSSEDGKKLRQELGIGESDKVITSVGNFNSETKGQRWLVEAVKMVLEDGGRLSEGGKGITLLLVGDGVLLESVKRKAQSAKLEDKVKFLGKRSDVVEILAASDVCVLPSLSEGLSNALIEYMAAGKPVVATAVGGNIEVIKDGVNGLLVPAQDPAAMALAIMKLLDEPALAERLGREARATVEQDFEVGEQIKRLQECCIEQEIG